MIQGATASRDGFAPHVTLKSEPVEVLMIEISRNFKNVKMEV